MGLIAQVLPANKRTMGVSLQSLIRRIPMAIGPVVGGLLIDTWGPRDGIRLAFIIALGVAGIATLIQMRWLPDDRPKYEGRIMTSFGRHPLQWYRSLGSDLRSLLISDILIRFCEQIPYAFVVIWCMQSIVSPVNGTQFGLLTTIEMATAVLVYIPVAYLADRGRKKPFVLITFVFFTLFPLTLLFCQSFWTLTLAFLLRGLKEFGEPTRKAMIMDLAPEDAKAITFGIYYLLRDTVVTVAALLGGLLWKIHPETNLVAAFAFGAVGTLWFAIRGHDIVSHKISLSPTMSTLADSSDRCNRR